MQKHFEINRISSERLEFSLHNFDFKKETGENLVEIIGYEVNGLDLKASATWDLDNK